MTSDIGGLELGHIFTDQTTAFKINISYGFILRNRTSGRYKYYHSSCNCCGRYLDEPSLITNADTFENFLERTNEPDILKWALNQRPNSDWVVDIVTNATIFVNRILQHPIGCVGIVLPTTTLLIWRPSRVADTPPLLPISRYGYCLFVADVCLCSEVLQPGGSRSSSGSGSM